MRPGLIRTLVLAAGPLLSVLLLVIFDLDLGQSRDLSHDVMFRDWRTFEPLRLPRFSDPSPYAIWASSDAFVWRSLRGGELPLWQRLQGGGYDMLIRIYGGVLHPVRWLAALVPRSQASTAISILAWWFAGIGCYLIARTLLGWKRLTSLFTSAIVMLAPASLSYLGFSGAILPLAHAPWLILFWHGWLARHSAIHLFGGSLLLGWTLLAGHPAMVMVSLLMLALALVFLIEGRALDRSRILPGVGGVIAGVAVAAPALLPPLLTLDTTWSYKNTTAIGRSYEVPEWSEWFRSLVRIVIDTDRVSVQLDQGDYFHYLGPAVAALVVVGVIISLSRRPIRWIGALTIIGFLISYPNPLTAWIRHVPILSYWKTWYLLWVFTFGAAFSAGVAIDWLLARKRWAAMLLMALVTLPLVHRMLRHQLIWSVVPLRSGIVERIEAEDAPVRITGLHGQTHLPNLSELSGVEDLRASSPVHNWRYRAFLLVLDPRIDEHSFPTSPVVKRFDSPYLSRFDTRYVLVSRLPIRHMATAVTIPYPAEYEHHPLPAGLSEGAVASSPSATLYRPQTITTEGSRARFSTHAQSVSTTRNAFAAMNRYRSDANAPDIVEGEIATPLESGDDQKILSVAYPSDRKVQIRYDARKPGLLILADSFAEGWSANVDGTALPIVPVNLNSRGVFVPGGDHLLEMSYLPPGFITGSAISLTAIVTLIVAGVFLRRRELTAEASPTE